MDLQDAEQFFELGMAYKDRGQTGRAVALFRRVLELNPGHGEAREELRTLPFPEPCGSRRAPA